MKWTYAKHNLSLLRDKQQQTLFCRSVLLVFFSKYVHALPTNFFAIKIYSIYYIFAKFTSFWTYPDKNKCLCITNSIFSFGNSYHRKLSRTLTLRHNFPDLQRKSEKSLVCKVGPAAASTIAIWHGASSFFTKKFECLAGNFLMSFDYDTQTSSL